MARLDIREYPSELLQDF